MSSDINPSAEPKGLFAAKVDVGAILQEQGITPPPAEPVEFSQLPRRQRRAMAKRAHLFKDKSGDAWRIASNHMKKHGAPRR